MIGLICLATSPLIRLNDSTVIVRAQDPWMAFFGQILAVFVGAILALMANYALQSHGFKMQSETMQLNQRNAAYFDLLKDIASSHSTGIDPSDTLFHEFQAYLYGSKAVRDEIANSSKTKNSNPKLSLFSSTRKLEAIIIIELSEKHPKPKIKRQFWK
jgi:hypothetical protein